MQLKTKHGWLGYMLFSLILSKWVVFGQNTWKLDQTLCWKSQVWFCETRFWVRKWERRMYSKSSASNFECDAVIIGFDPSPQGWTLSCSSRLQFKIPHWDSTTVANARRASDTLLFWAGLWAPDVSQQETSGPNAVQHTHARATWYRVAALFDHEFPWHFQLFEFSARPH